MRASSTSRSAPVSTAASVRVSWSIVRFVMPTWLVGPGRDLREVGHHQHLVIGRQRGQGSAHGGGRRPADAGVDLVEHERRRGFGEHQPQGEHGAGQLAARGHLGQRQRRRAEVGRQQEGDLVAGIVAHLDHDLGARPWPARGGGPASASASPGAASRRARPTSRSARPRSASTCSRRASSSSGEPIAVLQLRSSRVDASVVELHDRQRGARRTCAAARGAAAGVPAPRPAGPDRPRSTPRPPGPLRPRRPARPRCHAGATPGRRTGPARRARRGPRPRRPTAPSSPPSALDGRGGPPPGGPAASASTVSLSSSCSSSSGSDRPAASISPTWNRSRSISRARARSSPPSSAELALDRLQLLASRQQRAEVDAAEPIERVALHGRAEQRLVVVLAVQVDQRPAQLGQRAGGGQPAVDVGARATVGGDDPAQDDLVAVDDEAALDHRLGRRRGAPSTDRPGHPSGARSPRPPASCPPRSRR